MYPHRINLRNPWQAVADPEGIAYRRVFSWPTELMPFEQLWLTVGGVDSPYRVTLNRQLMGNQADGRMPLEMNITPVVQNQNLVEIVCAPDPNQSFRGITRTVFLEVRRSVHLQQFIGKVLWKNGRPQLHLYGKITGTSERKLSIVVRLNDQEIHYEELPLHQNELNVTTQPFNAPRWQPGRENVLQQLEVHLLDPACVLAQHTFMTGFAQHRNDEPAEVLPDDEAIFESSLLNEANSQGRVMTYKDAAHYLPWLWHHPSLVCSHHAPRDDAES
ncbi:MAG TPA: hypothetical protein PLN21_18975 [Gemmatales bacterium]|nr:hypothetical protein [Gemmatales bacterium]